VALHVAVATSLVTVSHRPSTKPASVAASPSSVDHETVRHVIFILPKPSATSAGGGGGGNRQSGPIRRAEGIGNDRMTLRAAGRAARPTTTPADSPPEPVPQLLLDAKPLASGSADVIGLPDAGVPFGTSTGPGTGGGVGEGSGTGIGPGEGPGIGPGSGGGTGGGAYRPGGGVTAPRVITAVKPTYSTDALARHIQGTVALELVVRADGLPSNIRVVRSLDPRGLDEQAIIAARQWRFEPGRLNGQPVDVLVTLLIDFWIR
jgi:TonB family protein